MKTNHNINQEHTVDWIIWIFVLIIIAAIVGGIIALIILGIRALVRANSRNQNGAP